MKRKLPVFFLISGLLVNMIAVQADENVIASTNTINTTASAVTRDAISDHATSNEYTLSALTPDSYAKLDINQQKSIADMWHLTTEDITRYLWLMSNTPDAFYYQDKHLDPSWILGFEANNEQERQKYVMIAIQNERARIEKELAFQRDFTQLQQQLFPNQKPINWTTEEENTALPKPVLTKK